MASFLSAVIVNGERGGQRGRRLGGPLGNTVGRELGGTMSTTMTSSSQEEDRGKKVRSISKRPLCSKNECGCDTFADNLSHS